MVDAILHVKKVLASPFEEETTIATDEASTMIEESLLGIEGAANDEEGSSEPQRKKQQTGKEQHNLDGVSRVCIAICPCLEGAMTD